MTHAELLQRLIKNGYRNGKLLEVVSNLRSGKEMLNFEAQTALIRNGLELDRISVFKAVYPPHKGEAGIPCGQCWVEQMNIARMFFLEGQNAREIDYLCNELVWPPALSNQQKA